MVGGIDKYFQIAPCFRDEDPRADRHSCEFYQIDVEMSFVTQEDIYQVVESFTRDLVEEMVPKKSITIDFVRMSYHDALEIYGSDKPDLRFDLKMIESTEIFQHNELDFLREAESIKSLVLKEQISRKQIDILTKAVKES